MNRMIWIPFLALQASFAALVPACTEVQEPQELEAFWWTDAEGAFAEAEKTEKPLMVVFRCER